MVCVLTLRCKVIKVYFGLFIALVLSRGARGAITQAQYSAGSEGPNVDVVAGGHTGGHRTVTGAHLNGHDLLLT